MTNQTTTLPVMLHGDLAQDLMTLAGGDMTTYISLVGAYMGTWALISAGTLDPTAVNRQHFADLGVPDAWPVWVTHSSDRAADTARATTARTARAYGTYASSCKRAGVTPLDQPAWEQAGSPRTADKSSPQQDAAARSSTQQDKPARGRKKTADKPFEPKFPAGTIEYELAHRVGNWINQAAEARGAKAKSWSDQELDDWAKTLYKLHNGTTNCDPIEWETINQSLYWAIMVDTKTAHAGEQWPGWSEQIRSGASLDKPCGADKRAKLECIVRAWERLPDDDGEEVDVNDYINLAD